MKISAGNEKKGCISDLIEYKNAFLYFFRNSAVFHQQDLVPNHYNRSNINYINM